jgi:hypothetical protein
MAFNYTTLGDLTEVQKVNKSNRYLGGSEVKVHPYVKGYFYVFYQFPPIVKKSLKDFNGAKGNAVLLSLCEGFTPPGDRQLKTEDVTGMGGLDASFVTGQMLDRSFGLQYRELWGSPVFVYHRAWTSIINPYYGANTSGLPYIPTSYKGKILVIQTKPTLINQLDSGYELTDSEIGQQIIKVNLFDGVTPLTDLSSMYDSNINDNSIVRPSMQYRFDGKDYDETFPGVLGTAKSILSSTIKTKITNNINFQLNTTDS